MNSNILNKMWQSLMIGGYYYIIGALVISVGCEIAGSYTYSDWRYGTINFGDYNVFVGGVFLLFGILCFYFGLVKSYRTYQKLKSQ